MVACILVPAFELRAALRSRPGLLARPAALAPLPGTEPLLGPVTAVAEAAGVRPGMRLGEALATCPELVLVDQDPAAVEREWEGLCRRLEDAGFSVETQEPGCLLFETRDVERLYRGVEGALRRALQAVGTGWEARAGAAERRFAAIAAASVARAAQALVVAPERTRPFLAPLPLSLLPLDDDRREELAELGVRTIGELARLPRAAVADRLGADGRRAWTMARGDADGAVSARRPPEEIVETLEFPDAVGNELTLRRALHVLVDAALARPERAGREARKLALAAWLAGGGSWRRTLTLREPGAEPARLRAALGPRLAELPGPALSLSLELVELTESEGRQLQLVRAEGAELRTRLRDGLRQARASAGSGAVCTVVEVAPWSRVPESRALLVPRDD